ncbi:MAG: hypothetical protein M1820_001005 [Bogoriella megaspora]|nr:MAG: hypothetical protein M1820_001005 [Bogoriella megaspora]
MGQPSKTPDSPPAYRDEEAGEGRAAETASLRSAVSLHQYEGPIDDDDELPAYTDEARSVAQEEQSVEGPIDVEPVERGGWGEIVDGTQGHSSTSNPRFSKDPDALFHLLRVQATIPPHPILKFEGHHDENQRQSDGKNKVQKVTDFDVALNCTDLIVEGAFKSNGSVPWQSFHAVSDKVKAYRGFFWKRKAPQKSSPANRTDLEASPVAVQTPQPETRIRAIKSWCHIFTSRASHSYFPYIFRLERRVTEWNTEMLKRDLTAMIRQTNYRGKVDFSIKTDNDTFTIYSDHWMNRFYNNRYVYWLCIILFLWIITWPVLLLCTGRFSVIRSDWPYKRSLTKLQARSQLVEYQNADVAEESDDAAAENPNFTGRITPDGRKLYLHYASISEQEFLETWGPVIIDAAFARKQGCVTQEDYRRVMQLREASRNNAPTQQQEPRRTGNAVVDTAVGIFAGIAGVVDERDRAIGWGGDQTGGSGRFNVQLGGGRLGRLGRIRL